MTCCTGSGFLEIMYKERILKLLRASGTDYLSGAQLASTMGISRTMVWKHIKALEREGFGIEAVPSRGYRIITVPDLFRADDIRRGLGTRIFGREIHLLPEVASTNTLAMELAARGAPEGTVVLAEAQTAGKGRLGRKWISPRGNIYVSAVLRPPVPAYKAPLLTLMAAVATAAAIRGAGGAPALIKWPNDILVAGRKVSGLLTEMSAEADRIRHIVLGIGIDVNMDPDLLPDEIRAITTTLAGETGQAIDRTELLRQLLRSLEHWYRVFLDDERRVLKEWESFNCTLGKRVAVSGQRELLEGLAEGIDREGRLVIRLDNGEARTLAAGDVTILKKI